MPNTLVHIGVQGFTARGLFRKADLKWVYIGCIIPDIPWIAQRIVHSFFPYIDPYYLRLYCTVQASLFFCLLMSLALASISKHFWKIFIVLGLNSLFHLILDALQTKWGNGVHFFVPFSWQMTNFEGFWPESLPTYILTVFGIIYILINWKNTVTSQAKLMLRSLFRVSIFFSFIAAYLVLPFFILDGPEKANNHYVKTLRSSPSRQGSTIEFDRNHYIPNDQTDVLVTFAGEEIGIEGIKLNRPASVSVRGTFIKDDLIRVSEYHVHQSQLRAIASYLGLGLIAFLWIFYLSHHREIKGERKDRT